MSRLFPELGSRAQRGSKPRCHLLTDGSASTVAERLTALATPFATVSALDRWMPQGFADCTEAELDKATSLLYANRRRRLAEWWLPADRLGARTPNFDIASTCTIEGKPGLLLIEAKAHAQELTKEAVGRLLPENSSQERRASHPTIGLAIEAARLGLTKATGHAPDAWKISRDTHYQMSNRFAWSWKLTELGLPVVLVYLGFVNAVEMADQGSPIASLESWRDLVLDHSKALVPAETWGRSWTVNGQRFAALISTAEQSLRRATE